MAEPAMRGGEQEAVPILGEPPASGPRDAHKSGAPCCMCCAIMRSGKFQRPQAAPHVSAPASRPAGRKGKAPTSAPLPLPQAPQAPTLPYPTLPYLTYLTLPYLTLPYLISLTWPASLSPALLWDSSACCHICTCQAPTLPFLIPVPPILLLPFCSFPLTFPLSRPLRVPVLVLLWLGCNPVAM